MVNRAKQTITRVELHELCKVLLEEPNMDKYNHEDPVVVVRHHKAFLEAVAAKSQRINGGALAEIARDVFQLKRTEAEMFGARLSKAMSYCLKAGDNARNGKKLAPEILTVYNAFDLQKRNAKNDLTKNHMCKAKDPEETNFKKSASPPRRALRKALSSPRAIARLYAGQWASTQVIQCIHICMVCIYIFIYIYMLASTNTQEPCTS